MCCAMPNVDYGIDRAADAQAPAAKTDGATAADAGGPLAALKEWWRRLQAKRLAREELIGCDPGEVAHIARDLGLAPGELCTIAAQGPDSEHLLERRLAAVGVNPGQLAQGDPQTLRDLQRSCSQCESRRQCGRDLERDPASREWRAYCTNVVTIDALRTEARDRRLWRRRRGRLHARS